jgi:hypothetical protein
VPHLSQVIIAAKPLAQGAEASAGAKNYLIAKRLTAPEALHNDEND